MDNEEELRKKAIEEQKKKRLAKIEEEKRLIEKQKEDEKKKKQEEKENLKKQQLLQKQEKSVKKQNEKIQAKTNKALEKEKKQEEKVQKYAQKEQQKELKKQKKIEIEGRKKRIEEKKQNKIVDFSFEDDDAIRMTMAKKYNAKKQAILEKKQKKKKQKLHRNLKILSTVVIVLALSYAIYFCLTNPFFNISSIQVSNTQITKKEEIISLSNSIGKNIFLTTDFEIEDNIKKNVLVDKVNVKRKFPNTLEIEVLERTPKFYQQDELTGIVYVIDDQGYVISNDKTLITTDVKQISGLTITNLGERLGTSDIDKIDRVYKLNEIIQFNNGKNQEIDISKYMYSNNDLTIFIENEGKTVYLGNDENMSKKVTKLLYILEETKNKKGEIFLMEDSQKFKAFFREE